MDLNDLKPEWESLEPDTMMMTDDDLRSKARRVWNPVMFDSSGKPSEGGLLDPAIFGSKNGASCQCNQTTAEGMVCPVCGKMAVGDLQRTRMGYIELPVAWYGAARPYVAELLGTDEKSLEDCFLGKKVIERGKNKGNLYGAKSIEKAVSELTDGDVAATVSSLESTCAVLEDILCRRGVNPPGGYTDAEKDVLRSVFGKYDDLENGLEPVDIERALENKENRLSAIRSLQLTGMKPSVLMRKCLAVVPLGFRPITEIGVDPEGPMNTAYREILNACEDMRVAENLDPAVARNTENKLAETLCRTSEDLDLLSQKTGIGRVYQSVRIPYSYYSQAAPNANLDVDEVSIPYHALLSMYRNEMLGRLTGKLRERISSDRQYLRHRDLSADNRELLEEDVREAETKLKETADRYNDEIERAKQMDIDTDSELFRQLSGLLEDPEFNAKVQLHRFPIMRKENIWAPSKITIGTDGLVIKVNPAVCLRMTLDFDGDQLNVIKLESPSAKANSEQYMWSGSSPNSSVTGDPEYLNDREYAWGVWLATRIEHPENCRCARDCVVTNIDAEIRDGITASPGFIYAKHVVWKEDGCTPSVHAGELVKQGMVLGTDAEGKPVVADQPGEIIERDGRLCMLAVCEDRWQIPPGAAIAVSEGEYVDAGTLLSKWEPKVFGSMEESSEAFGRGEIDANCAIVIRDPETGESSRTCYGRILLSAIISKYRPGDDMEMLDFQANKNDVILAMERLWDRMCSDPALDANLRGRQYMETVHELQAFGSAYTTLGSFCEYDIYKYGQDREKGLVPDDLYHFNSIQDSIDSGMKGSVKNAMDYYRYMNGLETVRDAAFRAGKAGEVNKGGTSKIGEMQPVQKSGRITRLLAEMLYPYFIEKEDCGTDMSEQFGEEDPALVRQTVRGRVLAEDYTASDGEVIGRKGEIMTAEKTDRFIDDYAVSGRKIRLRTLNGCKCNGGCSKCYGSDPSSGRLVEPGMKIGQIAGDALSSQISEGMILKFSSNSGNENLSAVNWVETVLMGSRQTWKAALDGPKAALESVEQTLSDVYRKDAGIRISQKHIETIARAMVQVHVKGKDGDGAEIDKFVGYGTWLARYSGNPGIVSSARIMPLDTAARGPLGNTNLLQVLRTGGKGLRGGETTRTAIIRKTLENEAKRRKGAKNENLDR